MEVQWPMDRAVDGGEGQPGPELGPGGSCGDGRRVSWFAPQNQGGGWRLKTPSRGGMGVGLGIDGGHGRRRRPGSRCGRGGDGRRAASRAVRRPRRERRLGPRRGGGNLPCVRFLRFSQNRPPTRVSRTLQNRGPDLRRRGGITAKTSSRRKKLRRRSRLYSGLLQTRPV